MIEIQHNLGELRGSLSEAEEKFTRDTLRKIGRFADTRISARAIGTFMVNTGGREGGVHPSKITIRSGRTARAITGKSGEGQTTLTLKGPRLTYRKTISVLYAAIQEFGGVTHPRVTKAMRRFAWAQFFKTGRGMWKGIALTRKTHLTVRIPARPFLGPALEMETETITKYASEQLFALLNQFSKT